ncbi:MAG: hypothetical protein JWM21_4657 [Acidobacteria bacterium]|nr:hypothetical protein [Acidobacteriota bacterium]
MSKSIHFTPEFFKFLSQLKRHNNREWFLKNKHRYEQDVRDPFLKFIEDFGPRLHKISPHFIADSRRSGGSLLRIYRDMRFRPDGDPYQTKAAARFPHVAWKQTTAPGFYLHLEPGSSFFAGGLWRPDPEPRNAIREAIVNEPAAWKKAVSGRKFKAAGGLSGDVMQRMPPGYDPDHPLAEDLKRKDFITAASFTDQQVCASDFLDRITTTVEAVAPFMEFLTRALKLPWASSDPAATRDPLNVVEPRLE